MEDKSSATESILVHLLVGVVVLLLSIFYLQSNRQAASRDAIAYAEKMQLQSKSKVSGGNESKRDSLPPPVVQQEGNVNIEAIESTRKEKSEEADKEEEEEEDLFAMNNNWRCACENGFLPPGMLGGAEAVFRMGTGQCYHKK